MWVRVLALVFLLIPAMASAQSGGATTRPTWYDGNTQYYFSTAHPMPVNTGPSGYSPNTPGQYTPVSDSAATSLTIPSGATYAVVCAEGANHRYTWDNTTTPTAAVGTQLLQNQCVSLSGATVLSAFKIIYQSSGGTFTASYGH